MQTQQRADGFEERVAAASRATIAAATEVQAVIGNALDAMSAAWTTATYQANVLEFQHERILEAARFYDERLKRWSWSLIGAVPPPELLSGDILVWERRGWVVAEQHRNRLIGFLEQAEHASAQGSQRMFGGRYRREAQTAAESALGMIRGLEAEADRLVEDTVKKPSSGARPRRIQCVPQPIRA